MEVSKSLRIIQCLADGVDPTSGEVLSADNPCQQPEVIRALFVAAQVLQKSEQRQEREQSLPANAGKPWDPEEDARLCEGFARGMTIRVLSQQHSRSQGAIQSRLMKLGQWCDLPPK